MATILLVDDESNVRTLVRDILEMSGHDVIEAADAAGALAVEAVTAGPIDLLLTDVMMPGVSGPDLGRLLGPRRPAMRIVYMSAYTARDFETQRIDLDPGVPIMVKPFSIDALEAMVRDVLAAGAAGGGPAMVARG